MTLGDLEWRSPVRYGFPLLACVLLASTRLAAQDAPGQEMQLPRSARGLPIVVVHAGDDILRLALDTGTSRTLVSAAAARRLELTAQSRFLLADAAGRSRTGLCGPAPILRLADVPIALECLAWIPEESEIAGAEGLDGLLGADALAQFDLWVDLRSDPVRARVAPPGSLGVWMDGRRLAIETLGRRPAIGVAVGFGRDTAAARLILDSGCGTLVLFGGLAERVAAGLADRLTRARVETPTASRDVVMGPMDSVRSGRVKFKAPWAGLLPHVTDRTEDGLLPLSALGPVLLDMSNGVVIAGAGLRTAPVQRAVRASRHVR
jgi:hypothetical protein